MSGPKTSRYTLTIEQRRLIIEQRKIQLEYDLLQKRRGELRSEVVQVNRAIEQLEPLLRENGSNMGLIEQAKSARNRAIAAMNSAALLGTSSELANLQSANQSLRTVSHEIQSAVRSLGKEFSAADRAFRDEVGAKISGGFEISFASLGNEDLQDDFEFYQKIKNALESLSEYHITDEQRGELSLLQEKADEIEDSGFLKNFYAMTVSPFVKKCRIYHEAYSEHGEEYERKRFEYEQNAHQLGITPERILFGADAIARLDEKIQEIEKALQFKEEQSYISRCVDEALQEMGYSVLGSREVVKRNGKKFFNQLYCFEEGTAVNVTYSNDGQITMELGGISTQDRIPTHEESMSLVSDMRTFCDDYAEIEKLLAKKSVITNRISVLPPDAQFAQLINVSDYYLRTDVSEYEVQQSRQRSAEVKTQKLGE